MEEEEGGARQEPLPEVTLLVLVVLPSLSLVLCALDRSRRRRRLSLCDSCCYTSSFALPSSCPTSSLSSTARAASARASLASSSRQICARAMVYRVSVPLEPRVRARHGEIGAHLLPPLEVELGRPLDPAPGREVVEEGEEDVLDHDDDAHDFAKDGACPVVPVERASAQRQPRSERG